MEGREEDPCSGKEDKKDESRRKMNEIKFKTIKLLVC